MPLSLWKNDTEMKNQPSVSMGSEKFANLAVIMHIKVGVKGNLFVMLTNDA